MLWSAWRKLFLSLAVVQSRSQERRQRRDGKLVVERREEKYETFDNWTVARIHVALTPCDNCALQQADRHRCVL